MTNFKMCLKIIVFLGIGFIVTDHLLKEIYESNGIRFTGNIWVNWFGVTYLLYFLYTIILGLFSQKYKHGNKKLIPSNIFWILFLVAVYVVCIPFIKGENPF